KRKNRYPHNGYSGPSTHAVHQEAGFTRPRISRATTKYNLLWACSGSQPRQKPFDSMSELPRNLDDVLRGRSFPGHTTLPWEPDDPAIQCPHGVAAGNLSAACLEQVEPLNASPEPLVGAEVPGPEMRHNRKKTRPRPYDLGRRSYGSGILGSSICWRTSTENSSKWRKAGRRYMRWRR